MITFSWKKIFKLSGQNPSECIRIISMLTYKTVPVNRYDPLYKYRGENFYGLSFLLNPEELLYNAKKSTNKQVVAYIGLASLRSLAEYLLTGDKTLDLFHVPEGLQHYLKNNRLLNVKDGRVHFLYEKS